MTTYLVGSIESVIQRVHLEVVVGGSDPVFAIDNDDLDQCETLCEVPEISGLTDNATSVMRSLRYRPSVRGSTKEPVPSVTPGSKQNPKPRKKSTAAPTEENVAVRTKVSMPRKSKRAGNTSESSRPRKQKSSRS